MSWTSKKEWAGGSYVDAREWFDCSCSCPDHSVRFTYNRWKYRKDLRDPNSGFDVEGELSVEVLLQPNYSFWNRLKAALDYLLGRQSSTWQYDSCLINIPEDADRLIDFLQKAKKDWEAVHSLSE